MNSNQRRFAEDTQVPIARSRAEIDVLLRRWGADGIQWTDDFARDLVSLRFVWPRRDQRFMARFDIRLPSREDLEPEAIDRRTRRISPTKLADLMERRGRREHRVLALWLKAALNAVECGIVEAEALFLPFLQDHNGKTFAEIALPRLGKMLTGSAVALLPAPEAP